MLTYPRSTTGRAEFEKAPLANKRTAKADGKWCILMSILVCSVISRKLKMWRIR